MKNGINPDRIDPEFLLELSGPIEDVYEAMERDLILNLARRFRGGVRLPRGAAPGSDAWRSYMLAQIGGLTEENIRSIAERSGDASEMTRLAVQASILRGIEAVEPELAKKAAQSGYVPEASETARRVMETYASQAINRQNLVNTVMLNSSLRAYRDAVEDTAAYEAKLAEAQKALNRETGQAIMGSKSGREAIRHAVLRMAEAGLTGFTDARGRSWSPEAYVAMDVKTTAANAARQAAMDRNEAHGNNLISVSSHPGARPLCAPWQGRIYSTDGTSGTVEDLNGATHEYIPLSATSYGEPAGLFGINCGHFPSPFIPGLSLMRYRPTEDRAENDRLYRESQEQRYMERKIRKAKTEADALAAAGDAEGAKELRRKARVMNAELQDWCADHKRTYLPERTRVWGLTKEQRPDTIRIKNKTIFRSLGAKSQNYDILSPEGDRIVHYAEGTKVQDRHVFAGYGTRTPLDDGVPEGLAAAFGGEIRKWQHVKGIGVIDDDGEFVRAEVHWFQEETVGEVKHAIKKWLE
jgi:hypothetical protein